MKLFKIIFLFSFVALIGDVRAKPYDDCDQSESEIESPPEVNQTQNYEGDCDQNEPIEKQRANESNESESNGNEETSTGVEDTDNNNDNGSCKEEETSEVNEGSDGFENFKDEVENKIEDVKNYMKAVLRCKLQTPGFTQCGVSGETVGFIKLQAGDSPMPTGPPETKDNNMTEFAGYTLGDWMRLLLSREIEKADVTFAPASDTNADVDN